MVLNCFLSSWLGRFVRDEDGAMVLHGLFTFLACCAIGAIGLDVTHFYAARTQLQVAADIAAHSAIYQMHQGRTPAQARADAVAAVQYGMPRALYRDVITPDDITFGTYDAATGVFAPTRRSSTANPMAVQVVTSRSGDNPVASFLFRIVGVNSMDMYARTLFVAVGDPCANMQGLFANGPVKPNSNNTYSAGFCLHSNAGIPLANNNQFNLESSVSAPNLSSIGCSGNSGNIDSHCPNLTRVWRTATYDLNSMLDPIRPPASVAAETRADLLADVRGALSSWPSSFWTGIDTSTIRTGTFPARNNDSLLDSSVQGQVVYFDCRTSGNDLNLSGTYRKTILLLHGCPASMQNAIFEDSVVYTTNQDPRDSIAIRGAGSLQIGTDNDCNGSGAAAILTRGGYNSPSNLLFRGGTVMALGTVQFAAQGNGRGMSIIAGGEINPTSNNTFTACPPPAGSTPTNVSFRLAK